MPRTWLRLAVLAAVLLPFLGCSSVWNGVSDRTGPGYTLDFDKRAIYPTNDSQYWDGQPMDARTTTPATAAGRRSP